MGWEETLEMAKLCPAPHLSQEGAPFLRVSDGLRIEKQDMDGWSQPATVPSLLLSSSPESTHDFAKASLHFHVGLTVLVDVGLAVLTAKAKFVVDLGEGKAFV